jgi:uncharacterized protein YbaP (TraB family)
VRNPIPLFLLLLPALCGAQDLPHSLLWRITSAEQSAPSYLYGTVHSKDDRAFQFGDSVLPAMARCAAVVGELDLGAEQANAMAMMGAMVMPEGQHLEDLYSKKEWKKVSAALAEGMGVMAPMATRMKPFYIMAMLMEQQMQGEQPKVLDDYLMSTAAAKGQRTAGLETMAEQLAAIDRMSMKEQAEMLLEYVDQDGYLKEFDAMMDAYAAQDLDALMQAMDDAGGMGEEMESALLLERNGRMVQRMDSMMRAGETCFFLVGAAHLPEEEGLILGLRKQGYSVEAVMSAARKPEE